MDVNVPLLLPFCVKELIVGFKSVYGMERTSWLRSKADLAAESTLHFHSLRYGLEYNTKLLFYD